MDGLLILKNRLLSRWSMRRILYTLVGGWIMVHAAVVQQWVLAVAGAWFFFMGLFAYGCAGGACSIPRNDTR